VKARAPNPLVHLELHTDDLAAAAAFYERRAGWRAERVEIGDASYLALDLGGPVEGGIVECGTNRAAWLPYVRVDDIREATNRASELGAAELLEPREGPVGWRSVIAVPLRRRARTGSRNTRSPSRISPFALQEGGFLCRESAS
jgi:predicted enzyme related to lactoylglutathione lyase